MNDVDRKSLNWSVRYIERGTRDDRGYVIPNGWWIAGFEEDVEESTVSIHIAQHLVGPHAAASLAAVISHLLNDFERQRPVNEEGGSDVGHC